VLNSHLFLRKECRTRSPFLRVKEWVKHASLARELEVGTRKREVGTRKKFERVKAWGCNLPILMV
jgi:hypothetical protein